MSTHEIEVKERELVVVHTKHGKLKFKTSDKEALKLYAKAFGLTDKELSDLKPTVKKVKEETRCLKTLESKTSMDSSKESSE